MSPTDYTSPFTLYTSPYSIRAIMVQLTHTLCGPPRPNRPDMTLRLKPMSIIPTQPDQLTEHYLYEINPKGKVPVLANPALLAEPMPGCLAITRYLCAWYPDLLPREHAQVIGELLEELHGINFSCLTFGAGASLPTDLKIKAERILERDGIAERYRRLLEAKVQGLTAWQNELTDANVEEAKAQTRAFCDKIENLKDQYGNGGGYMFGSVPTALDAHVLAFLRRMHDVGQDELVSAGLIEWAENFSQEQGGAWKAVVGGGNTMGP